MPAMVFFKGPVLELLCIDGHFASATCTVPLPQIAEDSCTRKESSKRAQ
jgi:hypothetical protein